MTAEAAESKVFHLSRRLRVEIAVSRLGMTVEWSPNLPKRLTRDELRKYRRARDEMLARLAEKTGKRVLVVEL